MGDFGADADRYAVHHPWADRLPRDADIGQARHGGDMRLAVFHYPLEGWIDAVTMNVLQGLATGITLDELSRVSYAPLAETFRAIAPRETRHTELGIDGLTEIAATDEGRAAARAAIAYWQPKVADSFGVANSARFETLKRFGLRHRPNEALLADWTRPVHATLSPARPRLRTAHDRRRPRPSPASSKATSPASGSAARAAAPRCSTPPPASRSPSSTPPASTSPPRSPTAATSPARRCGACPSTSAPRC